VDVPKQIKAKAAALCAYRSQFGLRLELCPEIPLRQIFRRGDFMDAPPARVVETDHCGKDAKCEH
jgi:hypothetical protein